MILDESFGLTSDSDLIFSTIYGLELGSRDDTGESIVFLSSLCASDVIVFDLVISFGAIVMFVGNLDKWAIEVGGSKNGSAEPNDNGLFKELGSVFTNLGGTFGRRLDGGITKFDCV